jgi:hypothetical protein
VLNACRWFESRRLAVDAEALFAELVGLLFSGPLEGQRT